MYIYEAAALGAAALWALTGLLSAAPAQHLGAIAFNTTRMVLVTIMLCLWVALTNGWGSIGNDHLLPLVLSGFVGIFMGDTALFLTLNRMGPRRTAMLFSLNAPMSAILGWLLLNEDLTLLQISGIGLIFLGVLLAIRFGKRKSQLHKWESIKGPLWIGVLLGLVAALSQSIGSLIARPIMEAGVDPVAASSLRVGTAALGLVLLSRLPFSWVKPAGRFTFPVVSVVALSGFLGMGVGMTLILFALSGGDVGIIATLSATTPALLLPMMWWRTKEAPALGAWVGAGLVIAGSGLLFAS
ncbi:EamA-like transporter family protein [Labrenzia sp. THAF82]|uniref:DMT family transporter n=1 Tax=Labrenzia sp. THAF82 TaxID=2587861 RepID=UPI0012685459|nr:DMT family transporter [Labrenzia sp. THAF82]QFT29785.1 EamA-like transporter family protein [Labrenzia sp. THAF82]